MTAPSSRRTREINADIPVAGRARNYWLGGADNFTADRLLADRIEALYPPPPDGQLTWPREIALRSSGFISRAVTWIAGQGVTQFLDLNSGPPASGRLQLPDGSAVAVEATHMAAQAADPASVTAYVNSDNVSFHTARTAATRTPGVAAVHADYTDPAVVLKDPALTSVIDPDQPVCVILALILHYQTTRDAREITGRWMAAAAPGSYLAATVIRFDDPALWDAIREEYPGALFNHALSEVVSLFAGTALVSPGVVEAGAWRPGWTDFRAPEGPAYAVAGVGRRD